MKTLKLIFANLILLSISCNKNDEKIEQISNSKTENSSTIDLNTEVQDYGSGTSSFIPVYEKLIAPPIYNHFYQGNSTKFPSDCCLPTAYMIGKGLFRNISVNDANLQTIITGMNTNNQGTTITEANNFAKNDLGQQCTELYITTVLSQAFNKIYGTINDGFPLIALVNIKNATNGYALETEGTSKILHFVLIVGIRVENFANNSGEILYIDPLSKTKQIKVAQSDTFIKAAIKASSQSPGLVNLLQIGCQNDALTSNYSGTALAPSLNTPTNNNQTVTIPVSFAWQNINSGAIYRIQVSKSLNGWTPLNGFPNNTDRIVNHNAQISNLFTWDVNSSDITEVPFNNTTYYWSVKSFVDGISSNYSTPVTFKTVTTTIPAPTALAATNITTNGFTSTWTGTNPIASGYYSVVVATDVNFSNILPNCPQYGTHANLTWNTLLSNTWYYYKIQTITNTGTSPFSNVIAVKTN